MLAKRVISEVLAKARLLDFEIATVGPETVLAVNYHGVPAELGPQFERHLMFFRERFECLDEAALLDFLRGTRRLRRPGIVLTLDDAERNQAEVAAPLLEKYGMVGWFFVPGDYVDRGVTSLVGEAHKPPSMTWEMVRDLAARGHVIGAHTWSHRPLGPNTSAEVIEAEVVVAQERLSAQLGRPVRTFCWVRGQVGDYSRQAHEAVRRHYDLAFTTLGKAIRRDTDPLELDRFNVEATFSDAVMKFQISRFNSLSFARRRAAVHHIMHG